MAMYVKKARTSVYARVRPAKRTESLVIISATSTALAG